MRRLLWVAASLACVACGGSKTCSEAFGQDCGPMLNVTLRYVPDGGAVPVGGQCTTPVVCNVTKGMPSAEYYYGVVEAYRANCGFAEPTATDRLVDCTAARGAPGVGAPCSYIPAQNGAPSSCQCPTPPRGAFIATCDWTPPVIGTP